MVNNLTRNYNDPLNDSLSCRTLPSLIVFGILYVALVIIIIVMVCLCYFEKHKKVSLPETFDAYLFLTRNCLKTIMLINTSLCRILFKSWNNKKNKQNCLKLDHMIPNYLQAMYSIDHQKVKTEHTDRVKDKRNNRILMIVRLIVERVKILILNQYLIICEEWQNRWKIIVV